MKTPNVVDSSAWLDYFANTGNAPSFAAAIEDTDRLIVPVVCIYEVFKKFLRERGASQALQAAAQMQSGRVVELDLALALEAARLKLPLADSLVYATAQRHGATLWTQDEHFKDLPGVRYFANVV
ncbi:MAG: type II toxin-antitoxin system VapC family toxin [Verrucomicrobiia bacterium]|jgi:predicted nucleic acid-binding protein